MLSEGDEAPLFELPGYESGVSDIYSLAEATGSRDAVLLVTYPFDFSPVCTNELCALRDANLFRLSPDLRVWGLSRDSVYAHRAFADEYDLDFALLSDSDGGVARDYGVLYDDWERHVNVPKRAVFLIDPDRRVRYSWCAEEPYTEPDFDPVADAVGDLGGAGADDVGLGVDYEGGPDELDL